MTHRVEVAATNSPDRRGTSTSPHKPRRCAGRPVEGGPISAARSK